MYDHQDKTNWSNNWICKIVFYTKLLEYSYAKFHTKCQQFLLFIFCGGRGLNPIPCIFYALSLPIAYFIYYLNGGVNKSLQIYHIIIIFKMSFWNKKFKIHSFYILKGLQDF